jgi:hypothetical protein
MHAFLMLGGAALPEALVELVLKILHVPSEEGWSQGGGRNSPTRAG